jgi:diacylglycerol kinase (ATP)
MNTPNWYFVINPVSGKGGGIKTWNKLKPRLDEAGIAYSFHISDYHKHAIDLVEQAYKNGTRKFIGLGGDGTLNEMLNGVFQATDKNGATECLLGLLPIGTGNDWVCSQQEPLRLASIIQKIKNPTTKHFDVGLVELDAGKTQQYYLNVAGAGLDGQVVEEVARKTAHGNFGKLSYFSGLIKALFTYSAPACTVKADDQSLFEGKPLVITASKGRYFGGGMQISPEAKYNSGTLDITLIKKVPKRRVFKELPKLFTGKIYDVPFVQKGKAQTLKVKADYALAVQADGEFTGTSKQVSFKVLPKAISILT